MSFIVVSGTDRDEHGRTPWEAYRHAADQLRVKLERNGINYEHYMNGLIDIERLTDGSLSAVYHGDDY